MSKLGARRPKDLEFCRALAATGYLGAGVLAERLRMVDCFVDERDLIGDRIRSIFESLRQRDLT